MNSYQEFKAKYGERPPDIVFAVTRDDTLNEVGEWLETRLKHDISSFSQGFITLADIAILKQGEMPK